MAKNRQSLISKFYPFLGRLPLCVLYVIAYPIYILGYYLVEKKRNVIFSNMQNSFPDMPLADVESLAKLNFKHLVYVVVEAIKTGTLTEGDIRQRVTLRNPEIIEKFAKNNQSVLMLAAHHCNWEWMLAGCSLGLSFPIDVVYKPLHDLAVDEHMKKSRSRFNARPIPNKNALIEIMQRRKEVRGFAMVADQSPVRKEEKYWTDFLNQDSSFAVGAQKIAKLTKYPVVFVGMKRLSLGHYEVFFEELGQAPYNKEGYDITEKYARFLEKMILEAPEDWMWSNRKWKRKRGVYD
ncbi:MAG TPA: lipid A biosynthesis protein [Cycloclasticus sp.]|jgi:KDO2-lipid IV(A) lauroyltransferase|nr:lipid A biosynthesis protein [Cycloclasticus sp.]HIL93443.1 lipid A biosynthesis protein [Cycloclasticus sp.]